MTRCTRFIGWFVATLFALLLPSHAGAHEFKLDAVVTTFVKVDGKEAHVVVRAPLYLFKGAKFPIRNALIDIDASAPALKQSLVDLEQSISLLEDGQPLKARDARGRLTLPSDREFDSYDKAVAHVAAPIEAGTEIFVDQGYVDAELVYPLTSPTALHALRTAIAPDLGNYLKLTVRYIGPDGSERALIVKGGTNTIDLNPGWFDAAQGFVVLGITHIVTGIDHLLFLLCLVIPLRGWRPLLTVVTGFTVAHSFTLIGSAFGLVPSGEWFPPFVEMVIALSIVYMAIENIMGADLKRRLLLTMLFGMIHGFGFSYGLKEQLQFAGTHLVTSLFAFNVGIEIGQLVVLAVMLPALAVVSRWVLPGRLGRIILSVIVAHVGWHWMTERWDTLALARWPTFDLASATALLFWLAGIAVVAGIVIAVVSRLRLGDDVTAPAARAAPT